MKKSLSLLLALTLVFGLFASMASAADAVAPTTAEKYKMLVDAKVLKGTTSGDPMLDSKLTRAEFATIAVAIGGLTPATSGATFTDVKASQWWYGAIEAAAKAGLVNGSGGGKFSPKADVTVEAVIKVAALTAGIKPVEGAVVEGSSAWAGPYIKAALDAGIIAAGLDYKAAATRGQTIDVGYTVYQLLTVPAELAVSKISQTGAKKLTVEFKGAITADEEKALTATVKNGQINYPVTIKVADDKKSAVLEATFLPAGEYSVTVNKFDAIKVTVVAAVVTKIEIGASTLQATYNQDLQVKALNQFNEEVKNESVAVQAYSSQNGDLVAAGKLAAGKLNLSGEKVDNTVVVTATHYKTGLSASKTYKLVAGSSATSIQIGQVAPLKDKTRISVNETGLVLPVKLADQYGANIKLPTTSASGSAKTSVQIGGIDFVVSDVAIVDAASFAVDADGVMTFKTGAKDGTVVITAVNPATGASASTVIKVEADAALKTFQVSAPGAIVVVGEAVTFPYVAADTFGAPIAAKDVPSKVAGLAADSTGFTVQANGLTVPTKWKANGDLQLTFPAKGNVNVIVWLKGAIVSQFNVEVNDVAYPVSITGTKDLKTTLTVYGQQDLAFNKLVVLDNYGRTMDSATGWALTFTEEGNANTSIAAGKVTGDAVGAEKVTAKLTKGTEEVSYDIAFNVIKNEDVKTVEVSAVGTVYAATTPAYVTSHSADLTLTGKTTSGTEVAIRAADFYNLVTSSDSAIVAVPNSGVLKVNGVAKGTATVTVWKNGTKLSEQTVTVSDVAPIATTVKFADAEGTATSATPFDAKAKLEVKDQYGKDYNKNVGYWYSSDATVASVDATTGVVSYVKLGTVTITYVSVNGLSANIVVNAE
ncbi:S-layer homology domain-containing protein [Cohnella luojiensis]|nr:S-layer homology domain-containing protein [Cohnella luojiensis]